jgi:hypothetical protein
MLCPDMRRMLHELDGLESIINDGAHSHTERSQAAQQAQALAARIREHRETHAGCDTAANERV